MPKYTFICQCGLKIQKYTTFNTITMKCSCGSEALRQLPQLNGPSNVTEVKDNYTGVITRKDQQEEVKQRKDEYYWTVEVPRFVQSGIYGVQTMLENDWIFLDDKGKVNINTKPPNRR